MRTLIYLVLSAILLTVSPQIWAADDIEQVLENATLYLFTNPEKCYHCGVLEKTLEASGQVEKARVVYKNKTYELPIVKHDTWKKNPKDFEKYGFINAGIPQFSIYANNKVQGVGRLRENKVIDKKKLLPGQEEPVYDYWNRVKMIHQFNNPSEADFSNSVLKAIGVVKNSLAPNPNFNPKLNKNNILLVGTAETPISNPIFTGMTLDKVVDSLASIVDIKPVILYGSGQEEVCDTCQVKPGSSVKAKTLDEYFNTRELIKYPIDSDGPSTKENISSYFNSLAEAEANKSLVVFVGHGYKTGTPMWLDYKELEPKELKELNENSGAQNILVSGNCYGGIMAQTMACAFMGATPKTTAAGCWEDAASGKDLPDYVSVFFKSINEASADYNSDGDISFSEAHSYAVINGVENDKPYTTLDALADEFFEKYPDKLHSELQLAYIKKFLAKKYGSLEELAAVDSLSEGLGEKEFLRLEEPEKKKKPKTSQDNDYSHSLLTLTKRLLFKSYILESKENNFKSRFNEVISCEQQSIKEFLTN